MNTETLVLYGVPLAAFVLAWWGAYALGKRPDGFGLKTFGIAWVVITGFLGFGTVMTDGWDVLLFAVPLIGIMAPAGVGGVIGGLIGRKNKNR